MHKIICIVNGKGGVGKSTVAINLAGIVAEHTEKIFLIDVDPQGTVSDWYKLRQKQPPENLIHRNLDVTTKPWSDQEIRDNIPTGLTEYNFVIIDCGPANDKISRTILALSHYAIIPVTPSPYDIHSVKKTLDMIAEGKKLANIQVNPHLLISRKIVGTNLGEEVRKTLEMFNVPVLKTEICQRVALCESGILGQTIDEYARGSVAAEEFVTLGKEILKW